jgi:hypothetical protein
MTGLCDRATDNLSATDLCPNCKHFTSSHPLPSETYTARNSCYRCQAKTPRHATLPGAAWTTLHQRGNA